MREIFKKYSREIDLFEFTSLFGLNTLSIQKYPFHIFKKLYVFIFIFLGLLEVMEPVAT